LGGTASATPGTGVKPISAYLAVQPNARIINTSLAGLGGLRIATGCGGAAWANFVGAIDNFTIGVQSNNTTYDFDPDPVGPSLPSPGSPVTPSPPLATTGGSSECAALRAALKKAKSKKKRRKIRSRLRAQGC
jgi:hypothetical protein